MQATKVVFLALIAFSAIFNSEAVTLGFRNEKNIGSALDIIKQMVEENIHVYEEMLKEMIGDATKNLHGELAKALEEISNTVNDVVKVIQYLQSKRASPIDCLKEFMPSIIALVQETQEAQTACIAESIEQIEEIHNKLFASLAEERQKVQQVIADIQNCSDRDCYKENGAKLIEIVGDVRAKVRASLGEAAEVIANSSPGAIECLKNSSDNFIVEIKEIHAGLVTCVKA